MPLTPGEQIGHYKIESLLGQGGMGEVYRAIDLRLKRDVALKILLPAFAGDPGRMARFQREAQALASLNHPNIAHIYDIGSDAGRDFIAMEFVAGETLDHWIGKRGLPLRDALKYSIQIADALAAAHAAAIVHRDLKPANVIVAEDGRVRLLDFGLAKLADPVLDSAVATETLGAPEAHTEEGAILGTVAYMSPEQAEGRKLDARSDIFSFGSVLYEMVSGRRAFTGPNKISTLSAILHAEPQPLAGLAPELPAELDKIISRCLRKDPDRRPQHVGDIKLALEELRDESASGKLTSAAGTPVLPARSSRRFGLAAILSAAVILLGAGAFFWTRRTPPAPARTDWVQITNFADSVSQPALSPDGGMVAFIRGPETFYGPGQIYVKILPTGEPVQLTHDDLAKMSPVFSPDGSRIAYTATNTSDWDTWLVPVLGGEPRMWLPNASGLAWFGKSQLVFSEIQNKAIHMALVTASESRANERTIYVPHHERGMAHRSYPSPDGKSILIVEMDERGLFGPCRLVPMDASSTGKLVGPPAAACTFAGWSPSGDWMYFSSDSGGAFHIWRQRFPDGAPQQITSGPTEEEGIAVAPDGRSLITAVGVKQSSIWLHDARGDRQISVEGQALSPQFTPDGKKLCYRIRTGASTELWIADLASGRTDPLLPGFPVSMPANAGSVWNPGYDISPDGRQVVFFTPDRDGKLRLWIAPLDRRSPPRQIPGVEGEQPIFGPGGEIFFHKVEGTSAFLYSVREDGSGFRKVSEMPIIDVFGSSPDRKWLLLGGNPANEILLPAAGGDPLYARISPPMWIRWTGDRKSVFVFGAGQSMTRAFVVPLPPGQVLPRSFTLPGNPLSEADLAKIPGVRTIPEGDVVPGPSAGVYAFTRESLQRNLYRIPLP